MSRQELSDEPWAVRKPLIPKKKEKKLNQWSPAALPKVGSGQNR